MKEGEHRLEHRFIAPLLTTVVLILLLLLMFVFAFVFHSPLLTPEDPMHQDLILFLPGTFYSDALIMLLWMFLAPIIMVFLAPLLARLLLPIHRILTGEQQEYFIIRQDRKLSGKDMILRSFFPGLLAINISFYLINTVNMLDFFASYSPSYMPFVIVALAGLIGIPIAALLVAPIWVIEGTGLVSGQFEAANIGHVGGLFATYLKGYTGISTIIGYTYIFYQFLVTYKTDVGAYLVVFVAPVVIMLFLVPLSMLLEYRTSSINKRLLQKFSEKGIDTTPRRLRAEPA